MPRLSCKLAALSLFTFALACISLAALAPASRRADARRQGNLSQRTKEVPKATVYGRAIYEGTSRTVRRARVLLVSVANGRPELHGLTDARGAFRITALPPGEYVAVTESAEHGDASGCAPTTSQAWWKG